MQHDIDALKHKQNIILQKKQSYESELNPSARRVHDDDVVFSFGSEIAPSLADKIEPQTNNHQNAVDGKAIVFSMRQIQNVEEEVPPAPQPFTKQEPQQSVPNQVPQQVSPIQNKKQIMKRHDHPVETPMRKRPKLEAPKIILPMPSQSHLPENDHRIMEQQSSSFQEENLIVEPSPIVANKNQALESDELEVIYQHDPSVPRQERVQGKRHVRKRVTMKTTAISDEHHRLSSHKKSKHHHSKKEQKKSHKKPPVPPAQQPHDNNQQQEDDQKIDLTQEDAVAVRSGILYNQQAKAVIVHKRAADSSMPLNKGHDCDNCRTFYEAMSDTMTKDQLDKLVSKCSRHRSHHHNNSSTHNEERPKSPQGFWDLRLFQDSQKQS